MKIFTIIVTFNGIEWLENCLRSLLYSVLPLETIVVDNGSVDGTQELISTHFPEVHLIQLSKNTGFGRANNLGIKRAMEEGADYVFLINQDVYVERDTVSLLIDAFHSNQELGIVSPIHLNGSGTELDKNFSICIGPSKNCLLLSDLYLHKTKALYLVKYVNCATWLVSRECIMKVGGFDPLFFHYGEDENYCQRVHYHGYGIGLSTVATIRHDRDERNGEMREEFKSQNEKRAELVRLCNINNATYAAEIAGLKRQYYKFMRSRMFRLDFKGFRYYLNIYREYIKLEADVKISRQLNSKGASWLGGDDE